MSKKSVDRLAAINAVLEIDGMKCEYHPGGESDNYAIFDRRSVRVKGYCSLGEIEKWMERYKKIRGHSQDGPHR